MTLVDTCGWIEWLADGPLAEQYQPFLEDAETLVVPTIVQFELYKWLDRNCGEEAAMKAVSRTTRSSVVDLDTAIALLAAELSRDHSLSVADAVIYASARKHKVELVTSDDHFEGLSGVTFFRKGKGQEVDSG
jgi:predicted nucleic acid-binding protein